MKFENKYLVPIELLYELRTHINPFMEKDIYMKMSSPLGYTVRSLYFDTLQFDYYYDKINGLKIRKKIRIRGYNELNHNNIVFLEIKRKNIKLINKQRAPIRYTNLKDLFITSDTERYILTDNGYKNALDNSQRFFYHIHRSLLQPLVQVIYEREAFFSKFDPSLRITFDKNLRSFINPDIRKLFNEENVKYFLPNHFILEVKYYGVFPSWLSSILGSFGLKLQSYSKYAKSIDEHEIVRSNFCQPTLNFKQSVHL